MNVKSMIDLAFDPAATEEEAHNAFTMARREILSAGVRLPDVLKTQPVPRYRFPFGKYKGKPIMEVAEYDVAYLQWFFDNIEKVSPTIINYIRSILDQKMKI